MNESHREFLRQVEELLQASERRIAARFGKPDGAIDSCLAVGGTTSSSSTSSGSDVSCVAEEPEPASFNPNVSLVVALDVEDLATPTPARCSIEGPSHDTTELRSASAPATASTTTTATVDIIPVLAVAAGSDGTLDGEATSGVASTPAICSMDCRPRHPMVAPVLNTSSAPTPSEYVLDTNSVHVAVVPWVLSDVSAPPVFALTVPLQQLYISEVFRLSSSQRTTGKVPVHRPMPWPSFMGAHADGDETRPLPWPSFREIDDCESPSDAVMKPSRQCSSGNPFTSSGCSIINGICIASELRCLDEVFLFLQYWSSASDCVQSVYATFVWPPCCISILKWVIIRSIELKLFSQGLDQSLILDSVGRSDSSYDHFSGVFRDVSHWHEYFVTEVHMHGCDRFQGTNVWYISYYSLPRLHTGTTCVNLLMPVMMGKLISEVVLPMIFLSNSYAALVEACSPCSVPSHSYKWLMLCSTILNKTLAYCYLSTHGHSEVVKWYLESAALVVYRLHTDLNHSCTSFRMLRASSSAIEERQPNALFFAACTVMLQSTELNSKKQSSWICEMPTKNPSICTWFSICESSEGSCCCVIVSLGLHRTMSLTDCGCLSSANVVLLRFYENMDQIGFLLQGGTRAHVSRLVRYKLWLENYKDTMQMQRVSPHCVHAFGLHIQNCCQNWQYAHSFKVDYRFDTVVLNKAFPAVYAPVRARCSICEVWLLNHAHRMPMLIAGSACVHAGFITNQLSSEDNSSCCSLYTAVLNKAFPAVYAPVCAGCTPPSIFDTSYPKQTAFYMGDRGLLFIQNQNGDIGLATRKQSRTLVLRTDVPWNPGGSVYYWRFFPYYDQDPFQGGRHARAVTSFLEQFSVRHKYYHESDVIHASISYHWSAVFDWVPVGHDFCFYLVAVYPNSSYYCDFDNIKDRQLQWDPGGFTVTSAWGQAEFQGGRGVRDPYLYMGCHWVVIIGPAQLPATGHARCYIYEKKGNVGLIQKDHGDDRLCFLLLFF